MAYFLLTTQKSNFDIEKVIFDRMHAPVWPNQLKNKKTANQYKLSTGDIVMVVTCNGSKPAKMLGTFDCKCIHIGDLQKVPDNDVWEQSYLQREFEECNGNFVYLNPRLVSNEIINIYGRRHGISEIDKGEIAGWEDFLRPLN